jgi:hypothetical protein
MWQDHMAAERGAKLNKKKKKIYVDPILKIGKKIFFNKILPSLDGRLIGIPGFGAG